MSDLSEKAKTLLHDNSGSFTFALVNGEKSFTSDKRGIAPILMLLENNPSLLKGAYIADKVIGKAAALLLIHGGVTEIYAALASQLAVDMCEKYNVVISCGSIVPLIKNRTGEGMCPMEASVMFLDDPECAYRVLAKNFKKMIK